MQISKTFLILLVFVFFSSCNKNDDDTPIPEEEDRYNVDIGEHFLLIESIEKLPYLGKSNAQFVDSLENQMILTIRESEFISKGAYFKYNIYEQGDTVTYNYTSEIKYFVLENDSMDLYLYMPLKASPYYDYNNLENAHLDNENVADILNIFCRTPDSAGTMRIFRDVIAQRTHPKLVDTNITIEEIIFFNKTFNNVIYTELVEMKSRLYFNYEVGIVAFEDHSGKLWRFERFIE